MNIRPTTTSKLALIAALAVLPVIASCSLWPDGRPDPPPPIDADVIDTQRLPAGMPLGGIGAGKIEIFTDGAIGNLTINNNAARPIAAPRGCFAAVSIRDGDTRVARMLRLRAEGEYDGVANIPRTLFSGNWPKARIRYLDPSLHADITLEAFTPIVPGDLKAATLPVAVFTFTVINRHDRAIDATIAMSWENLLGVGGAEPAWDTIAGNDQRERRLSGLRGVAFSPGGRYAGRRANAGGEYYLGTRDDGGTITTLRTWNALSAGIPFWAAFRDTGRLPAAPPDAPRGIDERYRPAAAVATSVRIEKGAQREIVFVFAWHTPAFFTDPTTDHGHYYANHFDNAAAVAAYAEENLDKLDAGTEAWRRLIRGSNLPRTFRRRLIDTAATLSNATLFTKDGTFAFVADPLGSGRLAGPYEADTARALTIMLFPKLERRRLELIARSQLKNGAIPGDCGRIGTGIGREFAAPPTALDACAFVVQTLHYCRWSGDREFFERMQPNLLAALSRLLDTDADGDGIPGRGPTTAAGATTFLATLLASEDLALRMNDRTRGTDYRIRHDRAQALVARLLWNGRFFDKSFDAATSKREALCGTDMLAGELMSPRTGLGSALSTAMVDSSLLSIHTLNAAWSPKLPPTHVDASLSQQSRHASLPDIEGRLAPLLILRGFTDDAFALLERADNAVYKASRRPWDAPARYVATTGMPAKGDAGLGGGAAWWALAAMTGVNFDAGSGSLFLTPRMPPGADKLVAPVFLPGFWAELEADAGGKTRLRVDRNFPGVPASITRIVPADAKLIGYQIRYSAISEFGPPVEMLEGETISAKLGRAAVKPRVLGSRGPVIVPEIPAPGPLAIIDFKAGKAYSLGAPVRIENVQAEPMPRFELIATRLGSTPVTLSVTGLTAPRYSCYVRGRRRNTSSRRQWRDGVAIRLPAHNATAEHPATSRDLRPTAAASATALARVREMRPAPEKLLVVGAALDALSRAADAYHTATDGSVRSEIMLQPSGAPPLVRAGKPVPDARKLKALRTKALARLADAKASARGRFYGTPEGNKLLAALLPIRWDAALLPDGRLEITAAGRGLTPEFAATVTVEPPSDWNVDEPTRTIERVADGASGKVTFKLDPPRDPLPNAAAMVTFRFEGGGYEYTMHRSVRVARRRD